MFEVSFDYPMPVVLDDKVICVDVYVTVDIEPTDRGNTDWCIVGVYIDGRKMHKGGGLDPKNAEHRVPRKDPLFKMISDYAEKHCVFAIEAKWDDWINSRAERIADAQRAERA